jgi:hypothetical protein
MNASPTTAENGSVAGPKTITRKPGHLCLKTAIALQEGAKTASSPECKYILDPPGVIEDGDADSTLPQPPNRPP